jgi:hypothetical protein
VKFRTIPPDPAEFPRARLIWPVTIPLLVLGLAWGAERLGHQWNIHGDGILVILAFALSMVVGAVVSAVSLASLLPSLREHASLRSRANLVCTGVSVAFVLAALAYIVWTIGRMVAT